MRKRESQVEHKKEHTWGCHKGFLQKENSVSDVRHGHFNVIMYFYSCMKNYYKNVKTKFVKKKNSCFLH